MPLAYLLVTFAWMLLWLLAMLRNSASGLKQKMLARAEDAAYACSTLVFASWDFCIQVQIDQSVNRSLNQSGLFTRGDKREFFSWPTASVGARKG